MLHVYEASERYIFGKAWRIFIFYFIFPSAICIIKSSSLAYLVHNGSIGKGCLLPQLIRMASSLLAKGPRQGGGNTVLNGSSGTRELGS